MKNSIFFLLIALLSFLSFSCRTRSEAVHVIFDTDMGPDYDDVGAMAVLHALADSGEANILATVSSNLYANSVPCIEVINHYFGRSELPVGAPLQGINTKDSRFGSDYWADHLPARYPHTTKQTGDAPDAVQVYRKILSTQPDTSVHIISVGFLTNLAALLDSKPDAYSDLDGEALIHKKVKRLISMAGAFPQGKEFNVYMDSAASVTVFNRWPTPVTLSGFEIGNEIITGKRLAASGISDSPVKDAFSLCLKYDINGRPSWDQTAVLVGVRGCRDYFGTVRGRISVDSSGSNIWQDDPAGPHEYLVWKMPKEEITSTTEDLMMHQPAKK